MHAVAETGRNELNTLPSVVYNYKTKFMVTSSNITHHKIRLTEQQ